MEGRVESDWYCWHCGCRHHTSSLARASTPTTVGKADRHRRASNSSRRLWIEAVPRESSIGCFNQVHCLNEVLLDSDPVLRGTPILGQRLWLVHAFVPILPLSRRKGTSVSIWQYRRSRRFRHGAPWRCYL